MGLRGQDHGSVCSRRNEEHLRQSEEGRAKLARRDQKTERLVTSDRPLGRPAPSGRDVGGREAAGQLRPGESGAAGGGRA